MANEIIIRTNLEALLNVLDARATITVFTGEQDHYCPMSVMSFLCEPELMRLNGEKKVVGLVVALGQITVRVE